MYVSYLGAVLFVEILSLMTCMEARDLCDQGFTYNPTTRRCYRLSDRKERCSLGSYECNKLGATLASVGGEQENTALVSMFRWNQTVNEVWIGLQKEMPPGGLQGQERRTRVAGWYWTDHTLSAYRNWWAGGDTGKDEPSGYQSDTCTRLINNGYWADTSNNAQHFYICETGPLTTTTITTTTSTTTTTIKSSGQKGSGSNDAIYISVGVMIIILLAIAVVVLLLKLRSKRRARAAKLVPRSQRRLRVPTAKRISKLDISTPSSEPIYESAVDVDMEAYQELPLGGFATDRTGAGDPIYAEHDDSGLYENYAPADKPRTKYGGDIKMTAGPVVNEYVPMGSC